MRILYITFENLSLHKGSVVHVRETIAGLRKRGHEVGLMGRASEPFLGADTFYNLEPPKILVKSTARSKIFIYLFSSFLLFWSLIRVLRRYDVVYARDFHTVMVALIPSLLARRNMVFEMNGLASEEQRLRCGPWSGRILGLLLRNAEKWAAMGADRIVTVTPQLATYLVEKMGRDSRKITVVSNGVNVDHFRPIHEPAVLNSFKERCGIKKESPVVLFVGNLAPWQGVEYLIQAAPVLVARFKHIRVLVVGSGPLKESLEVETVKQAVSDHFIFTGMADYQEIPYYINMADVCLVLKRPLKSGYSPIKLYEYMACGKPVVASRVEGLEFIETERVGRLVAPEDPIMLGKALGDLLEDPGERIEMGERGRQLVLKQFSWDSKVIEIETVLRELA
jgi:starch synthase